MIDVNPKLSTGQYREAVKQVFAKSAEDLELAKMLPCSFEMRSGKA